MSNGDRGGGLRSSEVDADFVEMDEEQIIGTRGTDVLFDRRAAEWLAKENAENLTVKVDLYKFENSKTGEAKALVNHWENELPDQHDIGVKYGSGRYMLMLTFPEGQHQKRGIRGYRFRLHENYDELRRSNLQSQYNAGPMSALPIAGRGGNGGDTDPLSAGLGAVAKVLELLMPIMARQTGPSQTPDMAALMVGMYKGNAEIMKSAARENMEFYSDMQRNIMGLPAPVEEGADVSEEKGFLERIMPLLAEWVPAMLGQGPKAAATAATVRSLPLFKQAIRSKSELARIVQYFDGQYGPEKTDTLLARLRIKRPGAASTKKPRARTRRNVAAHTVPTGAAATAAAATAAAQ